MGDIAEQLIEQEMFGYDDGYSYKPRRNKRPKGKYKRTAIIHLKTPAEKKIGSIRKEIAIMVNEQGVNIQEARRLMNIKYGKGWRERGMCSNGPNQWSEEDLKDFK